MKLIKRYFELQELRLKEQKQTNEYLAIIAQQTTRTASTVKVNGRYGNRILTQVGTLY
jgi:hypothetical protein